MKIVSIIVIIVLSVSLSTFAQDSDKFLKSYKVSMYFGVRDDICDSFPNEDNVDFVNYIETDDEYVEYGYIGFASHFVFRGNWEADAKFNFMGGATDVILAGEYNLHKNIALNMGFYSYGFYINDFSKYHKIEGGKQGLYGDLETNYRQRSPANIGFYGGAIFKYRISIVSFILKVNGGFSSTVPFQDVVNQKQINGNYKRQYIYDTKYTYNPFLLQETEIDFDIINFKNSKLGIQIQSNFFVTQKAINYTLTTNEWTLEHPQKENIVSEKHTYLKLQVDAGLYLRW